MKKIQFLTLVILFGTSCYSATNGQIHQVTPPSPNAAVKFVNPFDDPEQIAKEKAMLGELDSISDDLKAQSERIHAESEEIKLQEYMKKVQEIKEKKAELMKDTVSGVKTVKAEEDQAFQEIVKSHEMERNFLLCQQKFKDKFDISFPEGSEFDSIVTFFTGRKLPVEIKKEHMAEWANFYANQNPVFIVKEILNGSKSNAFSGYVVFMVSGYTEKWGEVLGVNVFPILAFNFIDPKTEILDKPLTIANLTAIMKKNLEVANGRANMKLLDGLYKGRSDYTFDPNAFIARILPHGLVCLLDNKKLDQAEVFNFLESFKSLEYDDVSGVGNFRAKWSYNNLNMKEFEDNFMKLFVECVSLLEKPGNTENVASLLTHFSKPLLSQYLKWLNGTHDWFEENPHLDACKRLVEEALK